MSEPCLTGVSLTDTTMCSVLNAASKETLPHNVRPEPVTVGVETLPTNLQTAISDCDGMTSCKLIGYNFEKNTAENMSNVDYVVDTYNTTSVTSLVLVKKEEFVPETGQYTDSELPTLFINPPGYEVLPMVALAGNRYVVINQDQVGCADLCDNDPNCKGFNSKKAQDFFNDPVCELYTDTATQVPSEDGKAAFIKETSQGGLPLNIPTKLLVEGIDLNSFDTLNITSGLNYAYGTSGINVTINFSIVVAFLIGTNVHQQIQDIRVRDFIRNRMPAGTNTEYNPMNQARYRLIYTISLSSDKNQVLTAINTLNNITSELKTTFNNAIERTDYDADYSRYRTNNLSVDTINVNAIVDITIANISKFPTNAEISGMIGYNTGVSILETRPADNIRLENQGQSCKNPMACNKEIARLISGTLSKFSTNDLDACALCPNRFFTRQGFTVKDEFNRVTQTGSVDAAISQMSFQNFDIPGCSSNFRLPDGTCVNSCPNDKPFSIAIDGTLHYTCSATCPASQPYYDFSTKICAETCRDLNKNYYSNGFECVMSCPNDKLYVIDYVCSTACPPGKFKIRKQGFPDIVCASTCPSDKMYINGDECVSVCPNDKYYDINRCVSQCPAGVTPNPVTRVCRLPSCPPNLPYRNGVTCVSSCPALTLENICVGSCPITHPYINGTVCVSACPDNKILDGTTCVSSCPATKPVIDYIGVSCLTSCPTGQIGDTISSGVYQCRLGTTCASSQVNNHGICMSQCTLPEFAENSPSGMFCTNTCPPDRPYRVPGTFFGCMYACGVVSGSPPYTDIDGITCTNTCSGNSSLNPKTNRCVATCPDGTVTNNRVCTNCPAGQSSVNGGPCTNCPAGQSSVSGGLCTNCPAGQISVSGGLCTNCPAGQSSVSGGTVCTNCPDNQTSIAGGVCAPCPAGQTLRGKTCINCPANQSSGIGGLCSPCPAGQSSVSGGLCTNCSTGTFSSSGGSCISCPANESSSPGSARCTPCPPSTSSAPGGACVSCGGYKPSVSGYGCLLGGQDCPGSPGSIFTKISTMPSGYSSYYVYNYPFGCYVNNTCPTAVAYDGIASFYCVKDSCPSGMAPSQYYRVCVKCPVGHYVNGSVCQQCPAGTYSDGEFKTSCKPCPAGTFSIIGSNQCTPCPAGKMFAGSNGTSPNVCTICPANTFSLEGSSVCNPCWKDVYDNLQKTTVRINGTSDPGSWAFSECKFV